MVLQVVCVFALLQSLCYAQTTSPDKEDACQQGNNLDAIIEILNRNFAETKDACSYKAENGNNPTETGTTVASSEDGPLPQNCADIQSQGHSQSGVYTVYLCKDGVTSRNKPIRVFCDLTTEGGGWLVIQKRLDGSESFLRSWNTYKGGFGDLDSDFWLGNDPIHQILNSCGQAFELRFDLANFVGGTKYAKYNLFNITDETDQYRLVNVGNYTGTAGDGLTYHSGSKFTTIDEDNDSHATLNLAQKFRGAWWYKTDYNVNINGLYLRGKLDAAEGDNGNVWKPWEAKNSLMKTDMKIRPKTL